MDNSATWAAAKLFTVLVLPFLLLTISSAGVSSTPVPANHLERSYWLHATLGASIVKGYWAKEAPVGSKPSLTEIRKTMNLLINHYGANRLYLIYHNEIPVAEFDRLLHTWYSYCPPDVEIVPTLVLKRYDKEQGDVFTEQELSELIKLLQPHQCKIAVYDVMPNRDQGAGLPLLGKATGGRLIRVGIQPDEKIENPFSEAVQDTWSGLCSGKTNEDWKAPGFGAESLRGWVRLRNEQGRKIDWDLVAVAWDYSTTKRGEFPGYDDAAKNMPLPPGRNRLAAREILAVAHPEIMSGFSSDLLILESNSRDPNRDGEAKSFYKWLRKGEVYKGCFSEPLEEIAEIYRGLKDGKIP